MDLEKNIERIAIALENINESLQEISSNIEGNRIDNEIVGVDYQLHRIDNILSAMYNLMRRSIE